MQKLQGWVEQGNTKVVTSGLQSSTLVQGSFPEATVTVNIATPTTISITAISRASNVVTVTFALGGSGFVIGQPVTISRVTDTSFNGTFTVLANSATTITYAQTGSDGSSSGGTAAQSLATIYSDNSGTPKANPFTAAADGEWFFYAINGRYSVTFASTGLTTFTIGDVMVADMTNLPIYANNAAAITGGLQPGAFYRSGGDPDVVRVVH